MMDLVPEYRVPEVVIVAFVMQDASDIIAFSYFHQQLQKNLNLDLVVLSVE